MVGGRLFDEASWPKQRSLVVFALVVLEAFHNGRRSHSTPYPPVQFDVLLLATVCDAWDAWDAWWESFAKEIVPAAAECH